MKKGLLLFIALILITSFAILLYLSLKNNHSLQAPLNDESEAKNLLISNNWCTGSNNRDKGPLVEYKVFGFTADGGYSWKTITDYVPSPVGWGRWEISNNPSGEIVVILDKGMSTSTSGKIYNKRILDFDGEVKYDDGSDSGIILQICDK